MLAEAGESDVLHLLVIEPSSSSSSGSVLSQGAKEHLRAAIAEVVVRNGITLVPSSTLPDRLLRCELPGCLPQIAAASGGGACVECGGAVRQGELQADHPSVERR